MYGMKNFSEMFLCIILVGFKWDNHYVEQELTFKIMLSIYAIY